MTQSLEKINLELKNICDYMKEENTFGKAQVIGINLEGPFISKVYKGAQPEKYIVNPNYAITMGIKNIMDSKKDIIISVRKVKSSSRKEDDRG